MFILTFAVIGLSVFFYIRGMKTTLLFLSVFLSANLFGQNVYIPNAVFKLYLVGNSEINTNGDTEIQFWEASAYGGLMNANGKGISDLTGVEAFTALTELFCHDNQLLHLDLSNNTNLFELNCNSNQLISLSVKNGNYLGLWYFTAVDNLNLACRVAANFSFLNLGANCWCSCEEDVDKIA